MLSKRQFKWSQFNLPSQYQQQIQMQEGKCDHCLKPIPAEKLSTHEAYCYRNFVKCQFCPEMIDRRDPQQHAYQHAMVPCKDCEVSFERRLLQAHLEGCVGKRIDCQFCELPIKMNEFMDHAIRCGARTQKCEMCEVPVLLRDRSKHICVEQEPPVVKRKLKRRLSEEIEFEEISQVITKHREGETQRLKRKKEITQKEKKQRQQEQMERRVLRKKPTLDIPRPIENRRVLRTKTFPESSTQYLAEIESLPYKDDSFIDDSDVIPTTKGQNKGKKPQKKGTKGSTRSGAEMDDDGEYMYSLRASQQESQQQQFKRILELSKSVM